MTNSREVAHESWLVRCSPHAPGFSRNNLQDFIDDFYSYDFTGIFHNDERSDDSDIEIDLESVDVVGSDDDEEEADKMKPVSPAVDKEITNTWLQQEAACIVIDND